MPTWTDKWQAYAAVASTLIAIGSVLLVVATLRNAAAALRAQHKSTDVGSVIAIFERLDAHWRHYNKAASVSDRNFEFGQLISYYELSCRLFRDGVFQTKAAITLYEHLHDVLTAMQQNTDFRNRFDELKSQPDNFENIFWLCKQPRSRCDNGSSYDTT